MKPRNVSFSIMDFRRNGVLLRIFLSFLSLSLVLLFAFFMVAMNILRTQYEEQSNLSTQDMLVKAQTALDIALEQAVESAYQISQNESIISAVAVPNIKNVERSIEIVNHLQYVENQSSYIKALYFYSRFDDVVYPSVGAVRERDAFFDREIIDAYMSTRQYDGSILPKEERHHYFVWDDRIFLVYDFPLNAPYENATLYAELDKAAMTQILSWQHQSNDYRIQIYSADNTPVLNVDEPLPDSVLEAATTSPSIVSYQSGKVFLYQSPVTGWKYLYYTKALVKQLLLVDYLLVLFPLVPLILAASIFVSLNLTEYLYKPIRKMMNVISGTTYEKERGNETELDYLHGALTEFVVQNEDLTRAISIIRPELEQKVYYSLVTQPLQENESSEELFQATHIPVNVRCVVLAVQGTDMQCQPLGRIEANMCVLALKNILLTYHSDACTPKVVEPEDGRVAVVLTFPDHTPDSVVQRDLSTLSQFIRSQGTGLSFRLFLGAGGIYTGLHMLHTSYTEACQLIDYQKYLQDDGPGSTETIAPSLYKNYMLSQLAQALLDIQNADHEKAGRRIAAALERIFQQLEENQEPLERVQLQCGEFIDLMIGQLSDVSRPDDIGTDRGTIEQEINAQQDRSQLLHYMHFRYQQFLQILIRQQGKQQNKYISAARDYIREHYSDYTLSLDAVAQQIGIHPNYLSRLFKETLNVNFVEYLNKQRIDKAKVLLTTTRMMVKDIGFEVGFNSVQNYLRVFKKYECMTPKQYREAHGSGSGSTL